MMQKNMEPEIASPANDAEFIFACSFCGKKQEDVYRLIVGPSVFICNECANICYYMIHNDV